MKKNYDRFWYLFMLFVFPTAFLISPQTQHLDFMDTLYQANYLISEHSWGWIGTILFIPVGITAYLMPNDISYFLMGFFLLGFGTGPFLVYVFFSTTYPPGTKFLKEKWHGMLVVTKD